VLSAPHEATAAAAAARLTQNAATTGTATWVAADNSDPATPGRLIAAANDRFGRLEGALISVGGTPPGTIATTTDEAWRSAFESVFLGAVRLARVLAADPGGHGEEGSLSRSITTDEANTNADSAGEPDTGPRDRGSARITSGGQDRTLDRRRVAREPGAWLAGSD
jgi:hypothetical protein